jgi:hypothetical protein
VNWRRFPVCCDDATMRALTGKVIFYDVLRQKNRSKQGRVHGCTALVHLREKRVFSAPI